MSVTDETWTQWAALDTQDRQGMIAVESFWEGLTEDQRRAFVDEAEWQELRRIPEARRRYLASLVSLERICAHLSLTPVQVYWLISTRKLPVGALLDGEWRFAVNRVDAWVTEQGGRDAVALDVEQQMAQHQAGSQGKVD